MSLHDEISDRRSNRVAPFGRGRSALGQGTWGMGEQKKRRAHEVAALKLGLDLGMTLIDTAEMYGDGGAEEVVGEAVAGRRDEVFLVSKVLPHHATRRGTITACHSTLKRLGVEQLDLYLLHWREEVPLEETLEAFDTLNRSGEIRYWGVSNFDTSDMKELIALPGWRSGGRQSGPVQPLATRDRVRSPALVPRTPDSDHGVLADRPGPAARTAGRRADREDPSRNDPRKSRSPGS